MPTYVYKFLDTGETIEVQQAFTDPTLTEYAHPTDGSVRPVKKVFLPVGVTFKGGGFYKTDSRGGSSSSSGASTDSARRRQRPVRRSRPVPPRHRRRRVPRRRRRAGPPRPASTLDLNRSTDAGYASGPTSPRR